MPDKPTYLHRLPEILEEARDPKPIPFFRRADIEALFGLKRRQAIHLMHRIGAIRVSREIAVDQRDLVRWLERALRSPEVAREAERQARVIGSIVDLKAENAARARRIVLPPSTAAAGWPEGVSLSPGLLAICFETEQQLLERLFGLARVLASNPACLNQILNQ